MIYISEVVNQLEIDFYIGRTIENRGGLEQLTSFVFNFRLVEAWCGADGVSPSENKLRRRKISLLAESQVRHPSRDRYADSRKRFVAHLGPIKIALNYACPRRGPPLSPLISKFMNPRSGTGGTTTVSVERRIWLIVVSFRFVDTRRDRFLLEGWKKKERNKGRDYIKRFGLPGRMMYDRRDERESEEDGIVVFTVGWCGIFIPLGVNRSMRWKILWRSMDLILFFFFSDGLSISLSDREKIPLGSGKLHFKNLFGIAFQFSFSSTSPFLRRGTCLLRGILPWGWPDSD